MPDRERKIKKHKRDSEALKKEPPNAKSGALSADHEKLASSLEEVGQDYMTVGEKFKARPFLLAAAIVREGRRDELGRVKIAGIGPATLDTIYDLERGESKRLQELRERVKHRSQLLRIPGIADKKVQQLAEMNIFSPDDLRRAIDPKSSRYNLVAAGWITPMQALGLRHLKDLTTPIPHRDVGRTARSIFGRLVEEDADVIPRAPRSGERRMVIAGSYRRERKTSGDIDVLCVGFRPDDVEQLLRNSGWLIGVLSRGPAKITSLVRNPKGKDSTSNSPGSQVMQLDVRMVERREWGTALLYFTGSRDFNRDMRAYSLRRGYSLSEYGLKSLRSGRVVKFGDEASVFRYLGLEYVRPRDRERFRGDKIPAARK